MFFYSALIQDEYSTVPNHIFNGNSTGIQTVLYSLKSTIFQFLLYFHTNCEESGRKFSRQTVEEIFGLFTLPGFGLLVFISFGPGASYLN